MPDVMIIEALAQTAGSQCFLSSNLIPNEETHYYFVGIDKARFRKRAESGDQILLTARIERVLKRVPCFSTAAFVGEGR